MPPLSDAEKLELQRAVSVFGRDWLAIAATGACGGRRADALRKAWDLCSRAAIVPAAAVAAQPVLQLVPASPVAPAGTNA